MEFRLTWEGKLFASQAADKHRPDRLRQKQEMRKVFHGQLARLWRISRHLEERFDDVEGVRIPYKEVLGNHFKIGNYRLCPIVTKSLSLHCDLRILFLRADEPGAALQSGDIDNRIKTLIDALTKPTGVRDFGGFDTPEAEKTLSFACLKTTGLSVIFL